MGRPPKLTPAVQERIVEAIRESALYHKDAAALAGVDENTFANWFTAGAHEDAKPLYRNFYLAVIEAEADFKERAHKTINAGSHTNPKLALTLLGRRWPAQYGRKDNVQDRSAEDKAADAGALREIILERVERLFTAIEAPAAPEHSNEE